MEQGTVIITVSGGVAEIALNERNVPVSIIDFDDLNEVISDAPTGGDRHVISMREAHYLMEHDPDFWQQLRLHVLVEYTESTI